MIQRQVYKNFINKMGKLLSRPHKQPIVLNEESVSSRVQNLSPTQIWRNSQKSKNDVVQFMSNSTTLLQSVGQLLKYLSITKNKQKYQQLIKEMMLCIESSKSEERDELEERQKIYVFLQEKHRNTYLIRENQISDKHLALVEKQSYSQKLLYLYEHFNDSSIKEIILMNYPMILQKQAFTQFILKILQNYIFIDNNFILSAFLLNKEEQARAVSIAQKRAMMMAERQRNSLYESIKQIDNLILVYMQGINVFLKNDYAHGALLLFMFIIQKQYKLSKQQNELYLYTRLYELVLVQLNHLQISFIQFRDLSMMNIIDLLLEGADNLQILVTVKVIHKELSQQQQFNREIQEYAFSKQCLLTQCISLILNQHVKSYESRNMFINKITQSRFDLFQKSQSQQLVLSALQKLFISQETICHVKTVINIARLFNIFKINQKIKSLWIFIQNRLSPSQLQEKIIFFIKSLTSQYYSLSRDKNIKIQDNTVDISKPQSILIICEYLFNKIFNNNITIHDVHQIVFQHMLHFEKYNDVKAIFTSQTNISKFRVRKEMIQMLIVQNMIKQMCNYQINEIANDINIQLEMLKHSPNPQIPICKATFNLFKYLQNNHVYLPSSIKENINIKVLYHILQNYQDKININFDQIYEYIRVITSQSELQLQEEYIMTNQLLQFKSVLASYAYKQNHQKIGKQTIQEIKRFQPPWLTTKIIKILQQNKNVKDQVFGIALQSCVKGEDLQYMMHLWKQKEKNKKSKIKKVTQYFDTQKEYLIIDDQFINSQQEYRNVVAQVKFGEKALQQKKYELFFSLLGTQPQRAFYHAIMDQLQEDKIYKFITEAVKRGVMNGFMVASYFYKCLYFKNNSIVPKFKEYKKKVISLEQVAQEMEIFKSQKKQQLYTQISSAYLCTFFINSKFINTYINTNRQTIVHDILFNKTARSNIIVDLREQPMGTQDIKNIHKLSSYLGIDFFQLCLFSLTSLVNSSQQLTQKCQHILSKLIVLSLQKMQCYKLLSKLIQKVHSLNMLMHVLNYLHLYFKQIVTQKHIQVLNSLQALEANSQFYGIIPLDYFQHPIQYKPKWPISQNHLKMVQKYGKKTNIFVLSKCLYFFYGMNPKVEKKVLQDFVSRNGGEENEQWRQIMQKVVRK